MDDLIDQLISGYTYERDLWLDGQDAGFAWGPIRRPEENLADEHWGLRETFVDVDYPELGKTFRQGRAKWTAPGLALAERAAGSAARRAHRRGAGRARPRSSGPSR